MGKHATTELQQSTVTILGKSETQCQGEEVEENGFCAQGEDDNGIIDTCNRDDGGPLVVQMGDNEKQYTHVGIVSYGKGCALRNHPGVYGDVSYFLNTDGWLRTALLDGRTCGGEPIIPYPQSLKQSLVELNYQEIFITEGQCQKMCDKNPKCQDFKWSNDLENTCKMYGLSKIEQLTDNYYEYP